jgi:imidazolonepropionase-like amidohydrolase
MGTDCPVIAHGRNAEELALLVECGLSPLEAIAAATSVSARLLGLEDEIGRITVGHRADVLVVDGGVDIDAFRSRLRHVIQGGRKVGPSVPA